MNWCWIDRFVEFQSGHVAKAIKGVDLAGTFMENNFPPYQVMPNPLVIEGLAQTGGLLVCEARNFTTSVIMAKIPKAQFFFDAKSGDVLTYTATVEYIRDEGAMVSLISHLGAQLHAEVEMVFAHVVTGPDGQTPFDPQFFKQMMERLGAFDLK